MQRTDPYVRWCGRGGAERLPPIPITKPLTTEPRVEDAMLTMRPHLRARMAGTKAAHIRYTLSR